MLNYLAAGLSNLGISANVATLCGFALSFAVAWFISQGQFIAAAVFLLLAGGADLVDGKIARLRGTAGGFGALLDSSLDRYSDALYYAAIAYRFFKTGEEVFALLALSACAGAFQISYVRARSEGLGQKCQVGFWERGERTVLLIAALFAGNLRLAVVYLGILTHATALRRLLHTRAVLAGAEQPAPRRRLTRAFAAQAAFLIATLWLIRL